MQHCQQYIKTLTKTKKIRKCDTILDQITIYSVNINIVLVVVFMLLVRTTESSSNIQMLNSNHTQHEVVLTIYYEEYCWSKCNYTSKVNDNFAKKENMKIRNYHIKISRLFSQMTLQNRYFHILLHVNCECISFVIKNNNILTIVNFECDENKKRKELSKYGDICLNISKPLTLRHHLSISINGDNNLSEDDKDLKNINSFIETFNTVIRRSISRIVHRQMPKRSKRNSSNFRKYPVQINSLPKDVPNNSEATTL